MAAVRKKSPVPEAEPRKFPWALICAILLGGLTFLMIYVVALAPTEGMLSAFRKVLQGLFGDLLVISPLAPAYFCIFSARAAAGKQVSPWRAVADLLLLFCILAAVQLFFVHEAIWSAVEGREVSLSWADTIGKCYRLARGGGALGALIAGGLYPYLGAWGGLIGVILLMTILLTITGRLATVIRWVRTGSHHADQRRKERNSQRLFETEDTLLDNAFGENAPRRPQPDQRPPKLYQEEIRKRAPKAPSSARDAARVCDVPEPQEDRAKVRPEYVPGAKARPNRGAAAKKEAAPAGYVSMDELKIEPDDYEPVEPAPRPVKPPVSEKAQSKAPEKTAEKNAEKHAAQTVAPGIGMPKLKRTAAPETPEEETYNYPPIDLLARSDGEAAVADNGEDLKKARKLEEMLASFGIQTRLTGIAHGPAVTRFELQPAPGVKVSRITSLADNIALTLAAISVRIEAPIPGKAAVGVEVPNDTIETVPLRDVLESNEARRHASRVAVGLGKDNSGRYIVADIAKMPHVLIAGQTGSGKSVCINSIIVSILYRATPEEVKLILIDPKVVELSVYNGIPHLIAPVVTDPKKAASALEWAVVEMNGRYKKFAERGVRDIGGYNKALKPDEKPMPHMVIVIDELADLMMVSPGEVEDSICRLAQLARAAGMHLVIATQRPSVNVITGIIKANIPTRIAFLVASQVDSRTIIDHGGAEKLLGHGDMLYVPSGIPKPMRVQGSWVSDEEVHHIVEYIKERHEAAYDEDVLEHINNATLSDAEKEERSEEHDARLPEAIEIVLEAGQASVSMLQRRMRVGYARAGRLIDEMYLRGIVSEADGAKPREVLITREQYNRMFEEEDGQE